MADLIKAAEIEKTLKRDHDIGLGDERWKTMPAFNDNAQFLLREWLKALGVSEAKVMKMSFNGMINAHRAGRGWVIDNIVNENINKRFGKNRGRGRDVDVDINQLLDAPMNDEGGDIPEIDFEKDVVGETPQPAPVPGPGPVPQLDAKAIARAAEVVIGPRLRDAIATLTGRIDHHVEQKMIAVATTLGDDIKAKINIIASEAATAAALQAISENLPRRIELKLPNGDLINLKAEARHYAFDEILRRLNRGQHVYMVGPAGTGKTHLFKQVAEALGYDLETEFFPIDQALTKFDVKGYKGPTGEYVDTLVRRAVEFGGFMAIDESDMWAAAALGALNSILANDYGAFPDKVVKVHPKFRCIVAANTFGHGATMQYQGRNPLDAASLDRFAYVVVGYDEKLEVQLYGSGPWVQYVHRVRKAVDQLKLQHIVSMRAIHRGLLDLADGEDADSTCFAQLWRGLDPDTVNKIKSIAGTFTTGLREVA